MSRNQQSLSRLNCAANVLVLRVAALKFALQLRAGYRPEQPRVPRGHPDAGRWTHMPGYAQVLPVSRRVRSGGQISVAGKWLPITPAQQTRLEISKVAMNSAVARTRKIDPSWRPRPQAYESVEGYIQANESTRLEAELQFFRLTGRPVAPGPFAKEWIELAPGQTRISEWQRRKLDAIGQQFGCHGCGSVGNLTRNGHSVRDHQVPKAIGQPTRILPHCVYCSVRQGGIVRAFRRSVGE